MSITQNDSEWEYACFEDDQWHCFRTTTIRENRDKSSFRIFGYFSVSFTVFLKIPWLSAIFKLIYKFYIASTFSNYTSRCNLSGSTRFSSISNVREMLITRKFVEMLRSVRFKVYKICRLFYTQVYRNQCSNCGDERS